MVNNVYVLHYMLFDQLLLVIIILIGVTSISQVKLCFTFISFPMVLGFDIMQKNTAWQIEQCKKCGRFLGCRAEHSVTQCQDQEHSRIAHFDPQTGVWHALICVASEAESNSNNSTPKNRRSSATKQQATSPMKGDPDNSSTAILLASEETLSFLELSESSILSLDNELVARVMICQTIAPFHVRLAPKFLLGDDGVFGGRNDHLIKITKVRADLICEAPSVHLIGASDIGASIKSGELTNITDSAKKEVVESLNLTAKAVLSSHFFHNNQPFIFSSQSLDLKAKVRVPALEDDELEDSIFLRGFNTKKQGDLSAEMKRLSLLRQDSIKMAICHRKVYRLSRDKKATVVFRDCSLLDPDLPSETFQALCGPILHEKLINFFRAQVISSNDLVRMGFRPPRGLLIHGSAGTGKSSLCAYLADLADTHAIVITADRVFSRFYGDCESTLRSLFSKAIESAPATIIIDDIDVFCAKYDLL